MTTIDPGSITIELLGAGVPGPKGDAGPEPEHEWSGTELRFLKPDGSWGDFTDLKGEQGDKGDSFKIDAQGLLAARTTYDNQAKDFVFLASDTGDLYYKLSATPGDWSEGFKIRGEDGPQGLPGNDGVDGSAPTHEWSGTQLRFQNPDGSWGSFIDLAGQAGADGFSPAHQWTGNSLQFQNPDSSWGASVDLTGPQGLPGSDGTDGADGSTPGHEWNNTELRFQNPDGSWGAYTDLQGPAGNDGADGATGSAPAHQWTDTALAFQNPDGSWGASIELKGIQGIQGIQGEQGLAPAHEWSTTTLRFQNPDGSWGTYTDLKGEKGDQGDGLKIDAQGLLSARSTYDAKLEGFTYFATDTGELYFKNTDTSADWSAGVLIRGEQGPAGSDGGTGAAPEHEWSSTQLRFQKPDDSWGSYTDLQGPAGSDGVDGSAPAHQWTGSSLQFQNPDGSWATGVDLKGEQGIQGLAGSDGEVGSAPDHEWNNTELRFKNPDGSWGSYTDLQGPEGAGGGGGGGPVSITYNPYLEMADLAVRSQKLGSSTMVPTYVPGWFAASVNGLISASTADAQTDLPNDYHFNRKPQVTFYTASNRNEFIQPLYDSWDGLNGKSITVVLMAKGNQAATLTLAVKRRGALDGGAPTDLGTTDINVTTNYQIFTHTFTNIATGHGSSDDGVITVGFDNRNNGGASYIQVAGFYFGLGSTAPSAPPFTLQGEYPYVRYWGARYFKNFQFGVAISSTVISIPFGKEILYGTYNNNLEWSLIASNSASSTSLPAIDSYDDTNAIKSATAVDLSSTDGLKCTFSGATFTTGKVYACRLTDLYQAISVYRKS